MATPATPAQLHPPSPPSQTPVVDFSVLERQKENIQPLRTGRSASALNSCFSAPRADRVAALAQGHATHKAALDAVEEAEKAEGHDDPLDAYAKYVKWVIDNYPAGQTTESGIVPLIEKATRRFKDDERYKGDLRYLKLWVAYAGYVHDAKVIYQFLLANEIGTHHALLYEEYAGVHERSGSRAQADEIFQLGIARKAQPLQRLPARYADFQRRMLHLPPTASAPATGATPHAPSAVRPVLAPRTHPSSTPLVPLGPATNAAAHSNARIQVFVDQQAPGPLQDTNEWPDVGTKASRDKENTQEAGPWKGEKLKMRGPVVTGMGATPARKVEVYHDPGEVRSSTMKTPSGPGAEDVFSRSLKPSEDQLLRENPFKNYSPTPASNNKASSSLAETLLSMVPNVLSATLVQPEPSSANACSSNEAAPSFVPPFCPEKLRLAPGTSKSGKPEVIRIDLAAMYKDGREWSLDEMRARRRGMLNRVWEDEGSSSQEGVMDVQEPLKDEPHQAAGRKPVERDRTMRLDAPTINTKAALDDVYGLFNTSPSKSDDGDEPPSPGPPPPSSAIPAQTPSAPLASKHNENATARKPSASGLQSRTPFTPFADMPAAPATPLVMATPTPAQGSLGRSAGAKAVKLELFVDEVKSKPELITGSEKQSRKPFEVFVDTQATTDKQMPSKKTPFEVFVEPYTVQTPARPAIRAPESKKLFEIFVEKSQSKASPLIASNAANDKEPHAKSPHEQKPPTAPLVVKEEKQTLRTFIAEPPMTSTAQANPLQELPSEVVRSPVATARLSFTDVLPAKNLTAGKDTANTLSFVDAADVKPPMEEPRAARIKPTLSFLNSPERKPASSPTALSVQPIAQGSMAPANKPLSFTIPPRPEMEELITTASRIESEDDDVQEEQPTTSWNEEDEERWIVRQEQQRQALRNARLGHFNVMTPITERTCEFTQMGSEMGSVAGDRDDDDEDDNERSALGEEDEQPHQTWEQVREEDKVVGEFEVSIARDDLSRVAPHPVSQGDQPDVTEAELSRLTGSATLGNAPAQRTSHEWPPNPCNPFDDQILNSILSQLPSMDSRPEFQDLRPSQALKIEGLQKYAKKLVKKSGNTTSALSDESFPLQLGNDLFEVKDKLGEGGFGAVFLAVIEKPRPEDDDDFDISDMDEDDEARFVAIKAERPSNLWECVVLQRIHDAIPDRLRSSVIRPKAMYAYSDESFLVLDFCHQGTLLDAVNRSSLASSGTSNQPGLDELLVMFFAIELIRLVEGLHSAGFIHGDMKIDNCLVRLEDVPGGASAWSSAYNRDGEGGWAQKGVRMIDFGRAIDTGLFPSNQTFIADWPTDDRDCVEMREQRAWTFQSDYFGLASIIYCMLFSKYIETMSFADDADPSRTRYKISAALKRYWQSDLWTRLFDLLLNPCLVRLNGKLPVTEELAHIRGDMESWLEGNCDKAGKSLKGLLKKVELAALDKSRRR